MHRQEGNKGVLSLGLPDAELTWTELSQVQSGKSELNHHINLAIMPGDCRCLSPSSTSSTLFS
ncbi:hypothetical protein SLEP1_g14034 [Rubroshorea leprosula]|uniref:Uncharacterized protein n=1 Tax=Rubroshorea leprosula TaxID=152421 RepID=A0AAV5INP9_9ROSI|nr:hypothetical protein SLEP1_g14034 [Rubroshorea leprosula]